jgi:hypothetical protein
MPRLVFDIVQTRIISWNTFSIGERGDLKFGNSFVKNQANSKSPPAYNNPFNLEVKKDV